MRRSRLVLLVAGCATAVSAGEVQVRQNGERIDVVATAAPLQDVLTRLSQQTGMRVVYDGTPPRALVTVSLVQRTPVEAIYSLFEGLGLNYALAMDRTGKRVEVLILSAPSAGASALRSGSAAAPPADVRRPPVRPQSEEEREEEQPQSEEAKPPTPAPTGPVTFQGPIPGPGRPGSPFGGQVGPLTLPTPPPAPTPTPQPTPTPSAGG